MRKISLFQGITKTLWGKRQDSLKLDCMLLDYISDGVLLVDDAHNIYRANQASERLFTLPAGQQLHGRSICTLIRDEACGQPSCRENRCSVIASLQAVDSGADNIFWHTRGVRANGDIFPLEITVTSLGNSLPKNGHVMILRDRSEQQGLEARAKQLQIENHQLENQRLGKNRFFAHMTHELRTPLNSILGYSSLVLEELRLQGQTTLREDLENVRDAGQHMLRIINEILDYSKIEAGQMTVYLDHTDLEPIIEKVADTLQPLFQANGNHVSIDFDLTNDQVESDATKLQQILFNLLSNANKFTKDGRIAIRVREESRKGLPGVLIEVIDSGIGINPTQASKLFQDFTQADAKISKDFGGTGLGLSISKHFCEMMGGDIGVESKPGVGSNFWFWLPRDASSPQAPSQSTFTPPEKIRLENGDVRRKRIASVLIIDTDPVMCERTSRTLANDGFRTLSTGHADTAIKLIHDTNPDIILLDVMMPDSDGWELLREIRYHPLSALTPIIAYTSLNDHGPTLSAGACDHVMKYDDPEQLLNTVKRWIRGVRKDRVMIVSHDPTLRLDLALRLKRQGYCVDRPLHVEQALRCLDKRRPALILLEVLPDSNTWQDFLDAKSANPNWNTIPILSIAPDTLPEDHTASLRQRVWRVIERAEDATDHLWHDIHDSLLELAVPPEDPQLQPNAPI